MSGLHRSRLSDSKSETFSTPVFKRAKRTSAELIANYLDTKTAMQSSRSDQNKQHLKLEARRLALEEHRLKLDCERNDKLMEVMTAQMRMMDGDDH
ncbi:hypothetical protein GN244_ATG04949 [Phytophthora infestans]|uniref:Uncharacterized protein n=1 Tax=Phytophthora infestans TaxID=4787 RepID=A0A833SZ83_PHYIN|nr:hypothetical protein GN244_ATG04949 [Phytophthora infestans]